MPTRAAAAATDREAFNDNREARLQHFRIGQPGVGHVGMHRVAAVVVRSRAAAAANGLVILVALIAEGEVVHRPLRRRLHAERAVERIGDRLRGLDVTGDYRRRIAWVEHRTLRHDDVDRLQTAFIHRDFFVNQRAEHVQYRRARHRAWRIEVVGALPTAAAEIDRRAPRRAVDGNLDADQRAVVHLAGELAFGEPPQQSSHLLLCVILHVAHVGVHHVEPVVRDHVAQLVYALLARRDLRLQVGDVLRHVARRVAAGAEELRDLALAQAALLDQQEVVDQHTLFFDRAAVGRHRARRNAADVGVVAARGDEENDFLPDVLWRLQRRAGGRAAEHRRYHRHIR